MFGNTLHFGWRFGFYENQIISNLEYLPCPVGIIDEILSDDIISEAAAALDQRDGLAEKAARE